MNLLLLYLLLLKAVGTTYGMASLPVVRADLVERYHVLTDHQLNTAVAAGRAGPGPLGLYVVSVGYYVAGVPGAVVGWLAMVTPAFLVIPLLQYLGKRAENARVKGAIKAVTLAGAGLLLYATVPLAKDGVTDATSLGIAVVSLAVLVFTRVDTLWVIAGSALVGMARYFITGW